MLVHFIEPISGYPANFLKYHSIVAKILKKSKALVIWLKKSDF